MEAPGPVRVRRPRAPLRVQIAGFLLVSLVLTGGLGTPFDADELPFETVRREHFDALAVDRLVASSVSTPSDAGTPQLLLRVRLEGDATDIGRAWLASADRGDPAANPFSWLRANAGVRVIADARGAPLFLTNADLSATSGRATLGATVRTGMAVEVSDPRLAPCVLVHEVLHFLGVSHHDSDANIMHAQCARDKLQTATFEDWQRARIASVHEIRAATPRGFETWAFRIT